MMDSYFYALIYGWLNRRITDFGLAAASRITGQVTTLCMILVTLWVMIRGYRLVTGASREPAMVLVSHMIKVCLIVFAADTVSIAGSDLYHVLNTTLPHEINYVIVGSNSNPVDQIDQNLLKVSAAVSVIDMVQVPSTDTALAKEKAHTSWMATLGIAAPAMSAGALLLMYQIALGLLTGLAPFFILCLIFDGSKELFRRWLMYLLSTLFSLAMLNLVISWVLKLTLAIAEATWTTSTLKRFTGLNAQGFNTIALQQGGIGLLMTVLIIATPPMAAMLFNGTLGTFLPFAVFGGDRQGRRGTARTVGDPAAVPSLLADTSVATTLPWARHQGGLVSPAHADVIRGLPSAEDQAMAAAAYGDPRYWTAQVGPPAPGTAGALGHPGSSHDDLPLVTRELPQRSPGNDHTYLDTLLSKARWLANEHLQGLNAPTGPASPQDKAMFTNTMTSIAWDSIREALPDAMRELARDTHLSFQERYDRSVSLPNDAFASLSQQGLFYQTDGKPTLAQMAAMREQVEACQHDYGLFNPKQSTLIASEPDEAGRLLMQMLGNDTAESLNPIDTGGMGMRGTQPFSQSGDADRAGFEVIGTILMTDPSDFQNAMAAYGLHVQEQNGGYSAGALDMPSSRPNELATSPRAERGFAVAKGVLDAASFAADVRAKYKNFGNTGQITVFDHEGKKYFEYMENRYRGNAGFQPSTPSQDSSDYPESLRH